MSAALQLPKVWAVSLAQTAAWIERKESRAKRPENARVSKAPAAEPAPNLGFYRKHTENLLRRYLYASTQVGRSPSILSEPIGRGWVSSHPVRSFEDAVIFVLDVERCLNRLSALDRQLLSRIVLQEYTREEAAAMLGMCVRSVSSKLAKSLDRLTEQFLTTGLLIIPD